MLSPEKGGGIPETWKSCQARVLWRTSFLLLVFLSAPGLGSADTIRSGSGNIFSQIGGVRSVMLTAAGIGIATTSISDNLHVSGNAFLQNAKLGIGTPNPVSSLQVSGTMGFSVQTVSSNTTLTTASEILVGSTSANNIELTLPYAGNATGRVYNIKKNTNTYDVLIYGGGNLIDNAYALTLSSSGNGYPYVSVVSNGSQWYVLDKNPETSDNTPLKFGTCILWLDASDSSTVSLSANNVTAWTDKSGTGRNFTQATSAEQPLYILKGLNGKNVVRFDGSDDSLANATAATNPLEIFLVARYHTAPSGNATIMGGANSGEIVLARSSSSTLFASCAGGAGSVAISSSHTLSAFHYYRVYFGAWADRVYLSVDAGDSTTSPTNGAGANFTNFALGNTTDETLDGPVEIAEVLVFSSALTAANSSSVKDYLRAKWGL